MTNMLLLTATARHAVLFTLYGLMALALVVLEVSIYRRKRDGRDAERLTRWADNAWFMGWVMLDEALERAIWQDCPAGWLGNLATSMALVGLLRRLCRRLTKRLLRRHLA